MTALGPTASAGDRSGAGGESTFNEFIGFVERFASLLNRVVSDLSHARELDPALRNALTDVLARERIDQLVSQIGSRLEGLNEDRRTELADHGLADESVDMNLKMAAFDAALRTSRYNVRHDSVRDRGFLGRLSRPGLKASLKRLPDAFAVANSVLKSASHVIPPAGALSEIKDSAEAGINLLSSGVRALMRRFRRTD